ncbi:CHASE3 domain-containing protein [Rhodopila sp.]|uniref:CHASE3 domain-containing protein n=1 Tax=Rhodopila sp. TaxID=2480087 RepID=UPI002BFF4E71|nr:CHASE3 domain-containing protein [Rhodopila sp.]HVZ10143.1 CHASE3 domain-containing protein [Rhodopila sp.]
MPSDIRLNARLRIFSATIALIVLVAGVTVERTFSAARARRWTTHTFEVMATIQKLRIAILDAEGGQRGFLLTMNPVYLAPYHNSLGEIGYLQGALQRLTADNPNQQDRLRVLAPVVQKKLEELARSIQVRTDSGLDAAASFVGTDVGQQLGKEIDAVLAAMTAEEQRLLDDRLNEQQTQALVVQALFAAGMLLAVGALVWAVNAMRKASSAALRLEQEHRAVAHRLRVSLDSISQGVAVFDSDFVLTNWNFCFQELLDLPRALLREGTPYAAIAEHVDDATRDGMETEDQIRHSSATRGPVTYELKTRDMRQLEVRRTEMPDGGFVLTISDMTKRAQAENVLREAQKMQAIGQLTGGIAHDFNNLLTVILGNLQLVVTRSDPDNPHLSRLERAIWAAQRGATLTSQLLAFARKQPLAPKPFDMSAVVAGIVPLLRRTLGENIEIRLVEHASLWPALADATQLENALLNLALNARDAMPDGGRLTLELANKVLDEEYASRHIELRPGDYAMLAVSDTGHGMSQDVLVRVFEPFFTTKPDGKGNGLGLAMVFGFVKQSDGHINIYSEPGEGTTVRLYLPRARQPAVAATQMQAPVNLPQGTATILVVEDEAMVREITTVMLQELGYQVLQAADGEEALRVFGEHASTVDLLLTDVVLPGQMRGRELADRIKAVRPSIRTLFMSGYTQNSIVHHGRLDDGVALLGKPFKREDLAQKVAEVLQQPNGDSPATPT